MKHKFLLRVLGVFSTLALLIVALPLSPVSAAASITLYPNSGPAGSLVNFSIATTATNGTTAWILFNGVQLTSATVSGGSASGSFTVPTTVTRGTYTVSTLGLGSETSATFTVTPSITLASATGYVGDSVAVTGSGFAPSTTVNFYLSGSTTAFAHLNSSSTGTVSGTITIPPAKQGVLSITANDSALPALLRLISLLTPK
ncbi:hypothetical protein C1G86_0304 [Dehalococcoides mccartyi]|uniref:IPT/TIG domain-containing protein n=1 Tax=Dehalococcoides mccartyi TaxID=61435 RepID=A0A328ETH7_9CHLR|nr:hypothetical protein C1G86_0304 [Dehalococcoides mccartyi]